MDEAAVAALRDLYSDLEIDGRVLDLGGASGEHFEFPPDALVALRRRTGRAALRRRRVRRRDLPARRRHPGTFAEVARVLKPGGHFVFTFVGGPDDARPREEGPQVVRRRPGFGGAESDLRTSLTRRGRPPVGRLGPESGSSDPAAQRSRRRCAALRLAIWRTPSHHIGPCRPGRPGRPRGRSAGRSRSPRDAQVDEHPKRIEPSSAPQKAPTIPP